MAKRMFEFMCPAGHITERFIDYEAKTTHCEVCGNDANRIISAVRVELDGTDPIYVTAYDKWAKRHEEKAKLERKQNLA